MSTPDSPAGAGDRAVAPQVLSALAAAPLPLALIDGAGRVAWCTPAFADAVGGSPEARRVGAPASTLLGGCAASLLDPPVPVEIEACWPESAAPQRRWRASASDAGNGSRLLRLEPATGERDLEACVADLQERLDLVEEFCTAGYFERDPVTMQGRWDAQMYRIYGLPVPPPGTPAPPFDEIAGMILQEDRKRGGFRATLSQAGVHADRVRVRRTDGAVRHIHSQWKVLHDASGQAVRVVGVNTDDTEVYELARRAQELREELDTVLRLGDIGLWRHDLASDRVHFDEQACRHLGLMPDPQGITIEQARALIHPDDLAIVAASREETLRTGAPTDMPLRYRRGDGGWVHMLSRRTLQRGAGGQPVAFVGVLLDETERVERARQTLELAHRLEAAAEAARIGLWSALDGDTLPDWNRRMFELLGLDPSQGALTLGEWIRRCVHAEDRERVGAEAARWIREGERPIEIEFRVVRASDGEVRWLLVRGDVDRLSTAGQRRVEGVAMDVTERHETLRRLRDTVERAALTASALGLGSWELDLRRGVAVWDEGMFRLRGVASGSRVVTREEMASYLHPDERQAVMEDQTQRLRSGEGWRTQFRVVWPDGTVRWLASRSAPVSEDAGGPTRRIGLNWDVTESVLAEQAMRERERAVAESQAKSRFLSRVSHELRTPLNAVLGFAQLLREERARADEALRREWLGQIEAAGEHLLALIDDVLDLSRVEAGDMRLDIEPVSLAALAASTLPLVEGEARTRDVALRIDEPLAGVVLADPVRLRQVLLNLLSNAVKYNRAGGQVRLSASAQGGEVALHVADTGRGIAPQALRNAFQPFNRLGAEASDIRGTGIGLAISKALVEHMGGRVEVQSRPGEGSKFSVVLPRSDRAPADPATPAPAAPAAGGPSAGAAPARVLYIEDNSVNALLVRELLAPHRWVALDVAADGRSGLQRAREWQPDLILLDMQLPDLDGKAVLKALRADPATAAIRCVALSANAMPDDIQAARAAGAIDYWTKPIQFARFSADLARLLGRDG